MRVQNFPSRFLRHTKTSRRSSMRHLLYRSCRPILASLLTCKAALTHPAECAWILPADDPQVTVTGPRPASILIIGDGPAAGSGVRTHQLGVAGNLARQLSRSTGRGISVEVFAYPRMSAKRASRELDRLDIPARDVVIVMLTSTGVLNLTRAATWGRQLALLVRQINNSDVTATFVTTTLQPHRLQDAGRVRSYLGAEHSDALNGEVQRVCVAEKSPAIVLGPADSADSLAYAQWAQSISTAVAPVLALRSGPIAAQHPLLVNLIAAESAVGVPFGARVRLAAGGVAA